MFRLRTDRPSSTVANPASDPVDRRRGLFAIPQIFPDFQSRMLMSGRRVLVVDIAAIALSYLGGVLFVAVRALMEGGEVRGRLLDTITLQSLAVFFAIGGTLILWLDSQGHYRQRLPYWESVGHVLAATSIGFFASGFIEFASHNNKSRLWIVFCWLLFAFISLMGRTMVRRHLAKAGVWNLPAVLIGEGATATAALRVLSRDRHLGFTILDQLPPSVLANMRKTRAWKQLLMMHDAHYVFLALEGSDIERYSAALKFLPRARVPCSIVPPWLGLPSSTMTPHHFIMNDVMMLHDTNRLKLPLPRFLKRVVDLSLSGLAIIGLAPLFIAVALIVRRDGGPAFFRQPRVGQGGKLFLCYKFRSMRIDAEAYLESYLKEHPEAAEEWNAYQKLKDDVRITKFGKLIRRLSIDELPQLINVLKGDMSLVGPRPCMAGQECFYAEDFSFYESVRPGITGPWQVSGRNQLTFKERVNLEAWYARNWSLWLDIVIMLKTVPMLLKREQAF
ncbi:MAG: undecaprenyl-phosphate galactose phosphotransferase WbaP [Alphaproteobacteria bacterium]|nr:undecaprenyl-phosphate galactose phosphotransferase WbaP [Alphaproteobacteria bacterium]